MKAMIFAAGLGTRLRPYTNDRPKAMVEILGRPMIEHLLLKLKKEGFRDIVINTHHFPDQIPAFLRAHDDFGLNIAISDERELLMDTGGGILQARSFLESQEPFLVHNVDIITDLSLKDLISRHRESDAIATLSVKHRKTSRYLMVDKEGDLRGWQNIQSGEVKPEGFDARGKDLDQVAFSGVHVISPEVFRYMGSGTQWHGPFSIIPFYLSLIGKQRISTVSCDEASWFDVGKPETLQQASEWLEKQL